MKRVSLFLKDKQIKRLKAIAKKQEFPWAFVARHAIDFYFEALGQEGKELHTEVEESTEQNGSAAELKERTEAAAKFQRYAEALPRSSDRPKGLEKFLKGS